MTIQQGAFLSTTNVWDISQIYQTDINSPEFKELLVRLYQNLNNMALVINMKDTGYYTLSEFVNSQSYFPNPDDLSQRIMRPVFRMCINFGSLPNTGTKTVPHTIAINDGFIFSRIYGAATEPGTSFIPLPYASPTTADCIELSLDATDVIITTGSDRTNYTTTYVVVEYVKQ